jgi:hypothetical protein
MPSGLRRSYLTRPTGYGDPGYGVSVIFGRPTPTSPRPRPSPTQQINYHLLHRPTRGSSMLLVHVLDFRETIPAEVASDDNCTIAHIIES